MHLSHERIHLIERRFPVVLLSIDPGARFVELSWFEAAMEPLRAASPAYQSGPIEHFQMFRHRRQADIEWLRQFQNGRLAFCEPRKNRSPRRICQRRKDQIELFIGHFIYPIG